MGNLGNKQYLDDKTKNQTILAIAVDFATKEAKSWSSQASKQDYSNLAWESLLRT